MVLSFALRERELPKTEPLAPAVCAGSSPTPSFSLFSTQLCADHGMSPVPCCGGAGGSETETGHWRGCHKGLTRAAGLR
jgi:hypothetical protein